MRRVGIDMAADPRNCAVCVLEDEFVGYVRLGTGAAEHPEWLFEHCSEASVVAVDVPFGWPKPSSRRCKATRWAWRSTATEEGTYDARRTPGS